jgi:hypothetical protein
MSLNFQAEPEPEPVSVFVTKGSAPEQNLFLTQGAWRNEACPPSEFICDNELNHANWALKHTKSKSPKYFKSLLPSA